MDEPLGETFVGLIDFGMAGRGGDQQFDGDHRVGLVRSSRRADDFVA